ncbi:HET-domain-containing protein [Pseudoneurospora amorphoporcata]|uniref:HET-domain-containing protein n=1 Tax=Pseudoneurospora amorphoporcata TaxID=241081 RepID=A0AAN6SBK7_9PEZI|nr:HET-domain-containing protein [Pseudoneurospora amorphoporcata]
MTAPTMDSTGDTAEQDDWTDIMHSPSELSEGTNSDSELRRLLSLPPHFRSYKAYIKYSIARFEPEGVPEIAYDRLCASCTAAFKIVSEMVTQRNTDRKIPFCSVKEFPTSAAEGNCHVCHWLMTMTLKQYGCIVFCRTAQSVIDRDYVKKPDSSVDALGKITVVRCMFLDWYCNGGDCSLTKLLTRGFPTSLSTASDASWNQALKWIKNCRSHPRCNPVQVATLQDNYPARLLAVGLTGEAYVRLCETSRDTFSKERSYMTLSHCWGKNGVPIRLLEENYIQFLNSIQLGELPNTFQSAKMQYVYRNSFLNLAAGASPDSSGGLYYRRDPLSVTPWFVQLEDDRYLLAAYKSEHTHPEITELILYIRRWELHWECLTCQASESFPDTIERPISFYYKIFPHDWESLLNGRLVDSNRRRAWMLLLRTYSKRSLTEPSDRLVAISGLAEQLSSTWSDCQPEMAISVGVYDDQGPVDVLAEVLDAKVTPRNTTSPFGPVACGASIRIRSPVVRARITEPPDENMDGSCHLELKGYGDTTELTLEEFNVAWDDNNDAKGAIQYAYLAPMQIETQDVERVWLYGLVLRKTEAHIHPYKPRFQRAGFFSLLYGELYPYARASNDDSDNDSNDGLDEHSPNGLFWDIDAWFAERVGEGPEERMRYLKNDPYVNGPPLNTNLEDRYPPKVERRFSPNILAFLRAIARIARANKANGIPDPVLGMGEGNGFYTYEIV